MLRQLRTSVQNGQVTHLFPGIAYWTYWTGLIDLINLRTNWPGICLLELNFPGICWLNWLTWAFLNLLNLLNLLNWTDWPELTWHLLTELIDLRTEDTGYRKRNSDKTILLLKTGVRQPDKRQHAHSEDKQRNAHFEYKEKSAYVLSC